MNTIKNNYYFNLNVDDPSCVFETFRKEFIIFFSLILLIIYLSDLQMLT